MFQHTLFYGLIPLLELCLICCSLYRKDQSKIDTALKSWLIFWFIILSSTEILSLFDALSVKNIFILHLLTLLLCAAGTIFNRKELRTFHLPSCPCPWLAAGIFIVLAGTFLCGISYPPDNWDSMTYHLARVASWIQHENIDCYFTPCTRQNYQMPLAEFGILHLQLLTMSDRLAFCIQWFSFAVSLLTVFRITQLLNGSAKSCWMASFTAAMLPMAFFQASSTQNDLAAASFLCIFARYLLRFTPQTILWTALSFGLALMVKGTSYLYTAVIGLIIGLYRLCSVPGEQRLKLFLSLLLTAAIGLTCSAGFAWRSLFHEGLTKDDSSQYFVRDFTPRELLRNLAKHTLLHAAPPCHRTNSLVNKIASYLNTSPVFGFNDRRSNWNNDFNFLYFPHEDHIGNFYHFLLYCFSILLIFLWCIRKKEPQKDLFFFALAGFLSFTLFAMVMSWNPWASRLHLPVFLLLAPLPALFLEHSELHGKKIFASLCMLILFFGIVKSGFHEGCSRRFGYPFREGTFPLKHEIRQTVEIAALLKQYDVGHLGIQCHGDDKTYLVFRAFQMHARKSGTMILDYDLSAPYILSFEHVPREKRKPLPGYQKIGENDLYRIFRKCSVPQEGWERQ